MPGKVAYSDLPKHLAVQNHVQHGARNHWCALTSNTLHRAQQWACCDSYKDARYIMGSTI